MEDSTDRNIKLIGAIVATCYFFYYASTATATDWHFIDNFNLLIHEAGHIVFMPFGDLIYMAGGSMFQVIMPAVFVGYFYRTGQRYSAAMTLFWVGQNLINVSVYARDAIVMQLPLLGGDTSGHDWHNILTTLHALPYTALVANSIEFTGLAVMTVAALYSIKLTYQKIES